MSWRKNGKNHKKTKIFLYNNQKIYAFLQASRVDAAARLIRGSILNNKFSCTSKEVQEYISFREEFVGRKSILSQIKNQDEARRLYAIAVNTMIGRFQSYILDRFCNIEVAGGEDMDRFVGWSRPANQEREYALKLLFNEEIRILEGMNHGN